MMEVDDAVLVCKVWGGFGKLRKASVLGRDGAWGITPFLSLLLEDRHRAVLVRAFPYDVVLSDTKPKSRVRKQIVVFF